MSFLALLLRNTQAKAFRTALTAGHRRVAYKEDANDEVMLRYRAARNRTRRSATLSCWTSTRIEWWAFATGQEFGDSASMLPLAHLQADERKPGDVTIAFVRTKSGTDIDALRDGIERDNPELVTVRTASEFGRADRNLQLISAADRGATIVVLSVGALIVTNSMMLSFLERTREFGVLRAIGWSRRRVMGLVVGEAIHQSHWRGPRRRGVLRRHRGTRALAQPSRHPRPRVHGRCLLAGALHLLAAVDRPSGGRIIVGGQDLAKRHNRNRYRRLDVGMVFQLHNLIPRLTARENVELAMFGTHRRPHARREQASVLLAALDLEAVADRTPPRLSGGERQRVAIARALANDPTILLADEPTGNLDAESVEVVLRVFDEARTGRETTVVMVTHDPVVAAGADRVIQLREGRVVQNSDGATVAHDAGSR